MFAISQFGKPQQTEDLVARAYRSGGLVQVQRSGLPYANQPDIEKSDDGRGDAKESDGGREEGE
jgi:hypothetical protein